MLDDAAEFALGVCFAVGEQIRLAAHAGFQRVKHRRRKILDIDKREQLATVAYAEVKALRYRLNHQIIITLVRTVDSRRAHGYIRKAGYRLQIGLGFEFRQAVFCICHRYAVSREGRVAFLIAHTEHSHRTHHHESVGHGIERAQRVDKQPQAAVIHTVEVVEIDTFGSAEIVHHIVPRAMLPQLGFDGGFEFIPVGKVEFHEIDAAVFQKLTRCGGSDRRPHVVAAPQRLLDNKSADKSAGACDQYLFCHSMLFAATPSIRRGLVDISL